MDEEFEITHLQIPEIFVYKVPTRQATGHRAENWKERIWTGRLLVSSKGSILHIKLVDPTSQQLFAECPVTEKTVDLVVERTVDSSRYFVIRLDDGSGRHAFVGLGFESRNDAFDFNVTIHDFFRRNKIQDAAESSTAEETPAKDYSLKEGEKMRLKIKGFGKKSSSKPKDEVSTSLIEPPKQPSSAATATAGGTEAEDDLFDFGNFVSAG